MGDIIELHERVKAIEQFILQNFDTEEEEEEKKEVKKDGKEFRSKTAE